MFYVANFNYRLDFVILAAPAKYSVSMYFNIETYQNWPLRHHRNNKFRISIFFFAKARNESFIKDNVGISLKSFYLIIAVDFRVSGLLLRMVFQVFQQKQDTYFLSTIKILLNYIFLLLLFCCFWLNVILWFR